MEETYSLNDLAMMTGFTTRTLRNYLTQGLLNGEKKDGVWHFSAAEIDRFFNEPFVKEGLRIKRSSLVFDFLSAKDKTKERSCVILDIPASQKKGNRISAFFCERMNEVSDIQFNYGWDGGFCRVILNGAAKSVETLLKAYYAADFSD